MAASASDKMSKLRATSKKEITIMLAGETGPGKTSFTGLILNLFLGHGTYELEERCIAETKENRGGSQTTYATLYSASDMNGMRINILDTPGLADSRGVAQDEIYVARINKTLENYVTTLDAIFIVLNGTTERMGAATCYAIDIITTILPYSAIDNVGVIFTHTDPLTFNFPRESFPPELRQAKIWLIQNPLSFYQRYKQLEADGAREPILRRARHDYEQFYDDAVDTLNDWLGWLDSRPVQASKEINELYKISSDISVIVEKILAGTARATEERAELEHLRLGDDDTAKTLAQEKLAATQAEIAAAKEQVHALVARHNSLSLAKDFTRHIRSMISMLLFRKKILESQPNTEQEVEHITQSIIKHKSRLEIIQG